MRCLRLCLLLAAVFLIPLAVAEEECAADLAKAANERSAIVTQLTAEQDRVKTLNAMLKEKEEAISKLNSELSSSKEGQARIQEEVEKLHAEVSSAEERRGEIQAELEKKTGECTVCTSELKISQGAEKQMEVELANSFARVQILSAETNQLTKLVDKLKGEVEEKEKMATIAVRRAALAEAELESMKEQMANAGSSFSVFLSQAAAAANEQLAKLSPYWLTLKKRSNSAWDAAMASPYVAQIVLWGKEAKSVAADSFARVYAKASPYFSTVYETGTKYGALAVEKINGIYMTAKPSLDKAFKLLKVGVVEGWALVQSSAITAARWVTEVSSQIYHSAFVAEVKRIASETITELESFIQAQMQQISSLQPFAKKEYVMFIVYSMLSLPPLFLITLLYTCFGRSEKKPSPSVPGSSHSHKKAKGHKKGKKGKVVSVGGDVVKYGA